MKKIKTFLVALAVIVSFALGAILSKSKRFYEKPMVWVDDGTVCKPVGRFVTVTAH